MKSVLVQKRRKNIVLWAGVPLLFLCLIFFFSGSCGLKPSEEGSGEGDVKLTSGAEGTAGVCSGSAPCKRTCKKIFETSAKLYEICLEETTSDVAHLNKVISAMEKGNWKSIKGDSLKVLMAFDKDIWPKYAGIRDKTTIEEMLLWVAEDENIAMHLDEKHNVLRRAFTVLGAPAGEDTVVQKGMERNVDTKEKRNFFEVSAFHNNRKAFEGAHNLLKEECDEDSFCIEKFYCKIEKTLVFGKLNVYGLAKDAKRSGSLHQEDCPRD